MSLTPLGPALPPHLAGEGPSEHLPLTQAHELKGHEGPVYAVRFNAQGTYCLTGGKVSGGEAALAAARLPRTPAAAVFATGPAADSSPRR